MLDVVPETVPASDVVKRFLRQRGDQLSDKNVVVLALHAPYFLDATEISKLTAYFGVYSKTRPFLESAARALFGGYRPAGAPPVDVPGTRYASLQQRLQPDPESKIRLRIFRGEEPIASNDEDDPTQNEDTATPNLAVGDVLHLEVGPILDLNGKLVPNGTAINFNLIYEGGSVVLPIETAYTRNGIATSDVLLERVGILNISANVGETNTTLPISISVQDQVTIPANTPEIVITPTVSPSTTLTPTIAPTETITPTMTPASEVSELTLPKRASLPTLLISLCTILITLSMLLIVQIRVLPRQTLVHSMLWAVNFGLGAYILYGLGFFPGAIWLHNSLQIWGPAIAVFIAMLFPLLWLQLRTD